MKFSIIDAFTDNLFGGNPAGVVLLPEGQDFPSDEVMVKTAAELRYSETAFIKEFGADTFNIRYFTPASEVDLCGHATIASFYYLLNEGIIESNRIYTNKTLAGDLEIAVNENSILMDMGEPQIFDTIPQGQATEELYRIMGLDSENQGICEKYPNLTLLPKKVSTGLIDIMLPVQNESELEKINPDFNALTELSKNYEVVGVHAFTLNTKDGKIHARNFAPLYDIDEEAATGTSNGALTYYLYDYGMIQFDRTYEIIQGEKMGRPSKILTQIERKSGKEKIKVGGSAVTVAVGEINI
ncbi:PhzF family phenazine biosynthesis protein [Sinanaerobacter sp. ZZT-01]|uniref:PhzF family phenazine biosynthesis protein n=1 Tax=Sinanaerobacter sp. ZZT-01 TaxID=3111540 RepID=UPI002D77E562|nr:PhzF family phenazine biosynthesis protein [Sinanaerobacter sp. ZZT-01]WRR92156.1 PhzF family phenazine biosynthesis protein [Sinanaerobacter sp. ZZT-01]